MNAHRVEMRYSGRSLTSLKHKGDNFIVKQHSRNAIPYLHKNVTVYFNQEFVYLNNLSWRCRILRVRSTSELWTYDNLDLSSPDVRSSFYVLVYFPLD